MNIVGFCEGARDHQGGVGIICVPEIHQALASRGHRNAVIVAGSPMPSARPLLKQSLGEIFESQDTAQTGVVTVPAYGHWQFAPSLYHTAAPWVAKADFV